jgi:hypothetical protein
MPLNIKFLVLHMLTFLSASALPAEHLSMPEVLAAAGPADRRPLLVARSPSLHRTWLTHCYGMVGVAAAHSS